MAEYLAHGYRLGDNVIQRALAFDQKNGISQRFSKVLTDFDSKYNATEKTRSLDDKYGVSDKTAGAWGGINSYFEQAINTPSGQKLRTFYDQGSKQVLDVHNEALHLAGLKEKWGTANTGSTAGAASTGESSQASAGFGGAEKSGLGEATRSEESRSRSRQVHVCL